jgi:hypothetical protein
VLEARTHTATAARERAKPAPVWGPVDVILALILLPFGVWMFLIDRLVAGIAWIVDRAPTSRARRFQ